VAIKTSSDRPGHGGGVDDVVGGGGFGGEGDVCPALVHRKHLLISFALYGSHAAVAYSSIGLTREVYANDLTSGGQL